jgi:hypothetical protein
MVRQFPFRSGSRRAQAVFDNIPYCFHIVKFNNKNKLYK